MNKVQKWKEDYDNWDNASALSLGMNVAEHQASKSYVLNLDEDGNIKQYTVIGGGGRISGPSKEELRQIEAEKKSKMKKEAAQKRIAAERSKKAADEQRRIEAETYHRQLLASAYENQALCLDAGGFYAYWNM